MGTDWRQQRVVVEMMGERELGEVRGGRLYHGSPIRLPVGTILVPGRNKNYRQSKGDGVSITSDLDTAAHWGGLEGKTKAHVYEVEPIGVVEAHRIGPADFGRSIVLWEGVVSKARVTALVDERVGVKKNSPRASLSRTKRSFDRHFDEVENRFPDFGTIELHHDERAGEDNGSGSERQFGYCTTGKPIRIAFASKIESLPQQNIDGLMAHEFGHALDHRYGKRSLERMLKRRLPDGVERRADAIAEAVFGRTVRYDRNDVQCVSCRGASPRPKRLGA